MHGLILPNLCGCYNKLIQFVDVQSMWGGYIPVCSFAWKWIGMRMWQPHIFVPVFLALIMSADFSINY